MSAPALGIAVLCGLLGRSTPARAYCRSTSCSGDCARDADGCKIEGQPLFWSSLCVGMSLQRDGSAHIPIDVVRDIEHKSLVAWSDIDCGNSFASIAFSPEPDTACHRAEYNPDGPNANIILFQDNKWTYTGVDNTLAKTTVSYDVDTGEILDADIELNHAYNELTTADDYVVYDLQSILTHELGHVLGLDHTLDFVATMNAGYQQGTTELRTLEYDDIDGLCAIYPPGRAASCKPTPRGGFANQCLADLEAADDGGCSAAPTPHASSGSPGKSLPRWPALAIIMALATLRRRGRRRPTRIAS